MKSKKEDGYNYSYLWLMVLTIFCWGIVPSLAKLGGLSGDLTTLYVNWVAVFAVALLITFIGKNKILRKLDIGQGWNDFKGYKRQDYLTMVGIGVIWPLIYSFGYFFSINHGCPSLTTILNYNWPIFYIFFAYLLMGQKANLRSFSFIVFAVLAVALALFLGEGVKASNLIAALGFGIVAAITQGLYSVLGDKYQLKPWPLTLVIEAVTAVGATIFVVFRQNLILPAIPTLGYLTIIGVFGNAIGFWSFLAGSQISHNNGSVAKTTYMMGLCLVPLVAVVLMPILGAEQINIYKLASAIAITVGLIVYRLTTRETKIETT
ncbi:MAG: DMT family transporter [Candidatus Cloacimonetes bacterium]|nr:DMT family transporter [Candidatus Cloacimonadota bacterium]